MPTLNVTQLSNGDTLDADVLNAIHDDLATATQSTGDSQMNADDPIGKDKIADRFTVNRVTFTLVPYDADSADYSSPGEVLLPASLTTFVKYTHRLASGQKCYLVQADVYVLAMTLNSSVPAFRLQKNGTTLGTTSPIDADDTTDVLKRTNPFDNPFDAVQDGDVFSLQLGHTSGSAGTARGVQVTLTFKEELIS